MDDSLDLTGKAAPLSNGEITFSDKVATQKEQLEPLYLQQCRRRECRRALEGCEKDLQVVFISVSYGEK